MHERLLVAEVFGRRARQVVEEQLKVARQVLTDFVLASLANIADCSDQLLVRALHVVIIGAVYLETHILHSVFRPELKLMLGDEKQRQCELVQDCLDVLLAQTAHFSFAKCSSDKAQGRVECLCANELRLPRE